MLTVLPLIFVLPPSPRSQWCKRHGPRVWLTNARPGRWFRAPELFLELSLPGGVLADSFGSRKGRVFLVDLASRSAAFTVSASVCPCAHWQPVVWRRLCGSHAGIPDHGP